jgi:hydrogenase/urease accessory protein HupE
MKPVHTLLTLLLLVFSLPGFAHKLAPSLLALQDQGEERYQVSWKTPRFGSTPIPIEPVLPPSCTDEGTREWEYEGTGVRIDWKVRCAEPLRGQEIRVEGLAENQSAALIRIEWRDGVVQKGMLTAAQPVYRVDEAPAPLNVAADYARMGVEHILGGIDHLLFVLGLLLLVVGWKRLVWTITAFTAGHSVTLALAALGVLRYPVELVEFAIAVSIFVIAVELTREPTDRHWLRRRPWIAAGGFGLLHGMGFAGALLDVGLPPHDIPLALLTFNIGIEIGQLLFVVAVLLFQWLWLRLNAPRWPWLQWVPIYLIGVLSAYWSFERGSAALLGG